MLIPSKPLLFPLGLKDWLLIDIYCESDFEKEINISCQFTPLVIYNLSLQTLINKPLLLTRLAFHVIASSFFFKVR